MLGYLIRKKSKGNTYIYLRRSKRENGIVKHEYIYSFGKMPSALNHLYSIANSEIDFPVELKQNGYEINHVFDWIMTLETERTIHGRDFSL